MRPRISLVLLFALHAGALAVPATAAALQAQVVNHTAAGNLQSLHAVGCIDLADASNTLTPADLYPGVADCARQEDYQKAIALYTLAGAYGRFDTLRVADRTAHAALAALQMGDFGSLSPATQGRLRAELQSQLRDPARLAGICNSLRGIGAPNYMPTYMIQHGMGAFTGNTGDGLTPGFDAKASWQSILSSYLHCPAQH